MTTNIQPPRPSQATDPTSTPVAAIAPVSTPTSLLQSMIKLEARGFTPIRHSFVQQHSTVSASIRKGPLAALVNGRRSREVNAYMLVLMNYSQIVKQADKPWSADVWARAMSPSEAEPLPVAAVSRIWANLENHGLIERSRVWKRTLVLPRDESAKRAYTRPRPDTASEKQKPLENYFILPSDYWTERWHTRLDLPARAVLLIMLHGTSAKDDTYLPYEKAESWYGISAKTAQRGIDQLRAEKLLEVTRTERVVADFSATGYALHRYYALTGPFSREGREKLQAKTASESAARANARVVEDE